MGNSITSLKRFTALVHDLLWVPVSIYAAYLARFNFETIPKNHANSIAHITLSAVLIYAVCFKLFGLYKGLWRFASIPDLVRIVKAVALGVGLTALTDFLLFRFEGVPRSVLILYPIFLFLGLAGSRILYRTLKDENFKISDLDKKRTLIIGAGTAGAQLLRELKRSSEYFPVGFLDDSKDKQNRELHGLKIYGEIAKLKEIAKKQSIDVILIAIPSAPRQLMKNIIETSRENEIVCRTLPSLHEIADGKVNIDQLRDIKIEDLLGREAIKLEESKLLNFIQNKTVLVTGAGGSIGSEICRQVLKFKPKLLIALDLNEYNLYKIDLEINSKNVVAQLGDIRCINSLNMIFKNYSPEVVFNAAAYKHVPLLEDNSNEAVGNNIFGSKLIADLASQYEVEKFVQISTDKAVNPTNIMGATKRIGEIYCQNLNSKSKTNYVTTRFGNVLDSQGSVVPLFRKQIKNGGPVTVTHPEITRYFMTIPEAVSLVLQAACMGSGGEIFVLDMGQPVKILDLAKQMIKLSGLEPETDIKIEFIGLRPGEKIYEELFHDSEKLSGTKHPKILLASSRAYSLKLLNQQIARLETAIVNSDASSIPSLIREIVPEFSSFSENKKQKVA